MPPPGMMKRWTAPAARALPSAHGPTPIIPPRPDARSPASSPFPLIPRDGKQPRRSIFQRIRIEPDDLPLRDAAHVVRVVRRVTRQREHARRPLAPNGPRPRDAIVPRQIVLPLIRPIRAKREPPNARRRTPPHARRPAVMVPAAAGPARGNFWRRLSVEGDGATDASPRRRFPEHVGADMRSCGYFAAGVAAAAASCTFGGTVLPSSSCQMIRTVGDGV